MAKKLLVLHVCGLSVYIPDIPWGIMDGLLGH